MILEQLADMKVNAIADKETDNYPVFLDRTETDNSKWLKLLTESLKSAKKFEIHCWNEEKEWIDIENKMTPFFNVFLDSGFQSSHYGTEIYIEEKR